MDLKHVTYPPAPILAGILSVMAALQNGCLRYDTVRLVTAALRRTGRQSKCIIATAWPPHHRRGPGILIAIRLGTLRAARARSNGLAASPGLSHRHHLRQEEVQTFTK